MATLNLGRIKPVFRGAYAGGTAYVVDDIVTSGDETFICILASTGNATSNATYWTKLAAKGTDGTDVGATLTTEGDILYRDGSGLQRLAKGTASQQLAMNSGATAPEWINASSDCVKLASGDLNTSASGHSIDNVFTSTYKVYKVYFTNFNFSSGNHHFGVRLLNTSGTIHTSAEYAFMQSEKYRDSSSNNGEESGGWSQSYWQFGAWNVSDDTNPNMKTSVELTLYNPIDSTAMASCNYQVNQWEQNGNYFLNMHGAGVINSSTRDFRGVHLFNAGSHNFASGTYAVYGFKH